MVGAVIYVRVSTKEQTENLSLPTQLRACEEYCRRQSYEVLERFHEEGESAKSTDRSQLHNLLTFCRLNKGRIHFVVVFNLTRSAISCTLESLTCPSTGVRGKSGDFEPLISEDLFYRAQAVRFGRLPSTNFRSSERIRTSHCAPSCAATRAVNVTKAKLEGLFADELALLQPSPGYMRLLKESVLQIWKARKAAVREQIASAERAAKAIQDKLDRLDEAFLFERSINIETYDRHTEKLREELTLARIDRHSGQLDELDVVGILAFAERVLPRAADLWVQASLEQRQRFQQLFFPDGITFDGKGFVGTRVTAPAFSYLRESRPEMKGWWPRFSPDGTH